VAEKSGVSVATVSRVINNSGYVEAGVRVRIETIMQELGYVPNRLGKNLATGHSHTIGLVITTLQSPFFILATEGIQDVLEEEGYHLLLLNTKFNTRIEQNSLQLLRQGFLEGIITTTGGQTSRDWIELVRENYPVVFINRLFPELEEEPNRAGYVLADLVYSAQTVTEYLLEQGHHHIGIICGDHNSTANRLRLTGYRQALYTRGLAPDDGLVRNVFYPHNTGQWAYTETVELLQAHPELTALLVFYHPLLPGVLNGLREMGRRVPDSVSLIGFDDFPLAPYLDPPLTVMTQPVYEMGRASARLLLEMVKDETPRIAKPLVLKPELIIRQSCVPVAL
jgi:DNA-binding LacI/PurR family transcriptional regulator